MSKSAVTNQDLSALFNNIANYLEFDGVAFKPQAYKKAAQLFLGMREEVADIYKKGGVDALLDLSGVGKAIATKSAELIDTGRLEYYEKLKKASGIDLENLVGLAGLGLKRIKLLHQELGIKNLKDLEKAAKAEKIQKIEGFSTKSELKILEACQQSNNLFEAAS